MVKTVKLLDSEKPLFCDRRLFSFCRDGDRHRPLSFFGYYREYFPSALKNKLEPPSCWTFDWAWIVVWVSKFEFVSV